MTTMELHMNNLNSGINSEVKLTPNGLPNTNDRGDLKRKSLFDSTYVKPLGIVGIVLLIGIIIIAIKALSPEEKVSTIDGGDVNTIGVNADLNGRDQLDANQAKYLSAQDRALAEQNARDGVSSAAVLNRAEATTDFTTYETSGASDASAITKTYQSNPKTVAQLDAENIKAEGELYSKGADDNGYIIFTSKETGQEIIPIDKQLAEGAVDPNATMNTNDGYNANNGGGQNNGGQNQGQNGQNNGGQNQGQTQGDTDQQQQQPPQPDPIIEAKRAQLSADFEAYQQQQMELDAKEQQLAQMQQERYMSLQEQRRGAATQSLNDSLARVQQSVGGGNGAGSGYTPLSYTQNTQNQGQQGQNQGQGSQNAQYGSQGQGYGANSYGQNYPVPYVNNNGAGYQGSQPMSLDMPAGAGGYSASGNNMSNGGYSPNGGANTMTGGYSPTGSANNGVSYPVIGGYSPNGGSSNGSAYPVIGGYSPNGTQGGQNGNGINVGFGNQGGNTSNTLNNSQNGEVLNQRLPNNILRAGTQWQAVITKSVNTDEGLQVIAELVTGKFAGSTIYGIVQPSGRNIGVQFQTVAQPNTRKPLIPIQAYATTIGSQKTAISNDVKNHYTRNYGIKGLSAVLRGVGEAYDGAGETSVITESGTVITAKDGKPNADKIRADVLGELGDDLTADIAKLGNRPPTYKVPIGTVVNVVLSGDLDINGTTSSIALGN